MCRIPRNDVELRKRCTALRRQGLPRAGRRTAGLHQDAEAGEWQEEQEPQRGRRGEAHQNEPPGLGGVLPPPPHHPCREPGLQGASAWGVGPGEDRQQREQDCLGPHLLRATESGALGTPTPPPHEYPPGVPKLAMPEIPQGTQ